MKILVTGGAGFLGANLCKRLLEEGHEVAAVDNFITGSPKNIRDLNKYPKFTFIKHNITQPFLSTNRELLTMNQIYHLACPTGVNNLVPLAEEMILTCSFGTRNVLELARKTGTKVLFTSSSEVYGDPQVSPQKEDYTGNVDTTGIRSPYEEGKRFAESLILMYVRKYNVDAKIVRVFNTYGPKMSKKDTRVIPQFLRQALANQPITIHGKGLQTRTHCYVDDLVKGLILVLRKGQKGQVYNVGGEEQITVVNLAKIILKLTSSKSQLKFVERPPHDHQSRQPDLTKIKKLGWKQKISLEQGIRKTIEA